MKAQKILFSTLLLLSVNQTITKASSQNDRKDGNTQQVTSEKTDKTKRLTIGGYGEAVYSRNFYSDNYLRYTNASNYRNASGHGRFDLPHVVILLGYDFGKGWSMGTEIEFEHGGTESAVEIEEEEGGEYESEIERGGEVALEQFWIQKSFCPQFNIRAGHIVVPVGATNAHIGRKEKIRYSPVPGMKPDSVFGEKPATGDMRLFCFQVWIPTVSADRNGLPAEQAVRMNSK